MSRTDAIFWIKNNPQLLPTRFDKLPASAPTRQCGCPVKSDLCLGTTAPGSWVPGWTKDETFWAEEGDETNDPDCLMCEANNIVNSIIQMCNTVNPKGLITTAEIQCMEAGYIDHHTLLTPKNGPTYNSFTDSLGLWVEPFRLLWEFETNEIIFNHAPMPWVLARLKVISDGCNDAMQSDRSLDECAILHHLGGDFRKFPPRTQKFLDDMYSIWQLKR